MKYIDKLKKEIEQTSTLLEVKHNGKTLVYIENTPSSIKPLYEAMIVFNKKRLNPGM